MSEPSGRRRRPAARGSQLLNPPSKQIEAPLIPEWVRSWAGIPLAVAALTVLGAIAHIGHTAGARVGWVLVLGALVGTAILWAVCCQHRWKARDALSDQMLYQQHEIAKVDEMTWQQFERYCGALLKSLGYRDVVVTGSTGDDHGADIIATAPDDTAVAVQCKRRGTSITPDVIRELIGTIVSGKHQGRAGMLMTNALVTSGARQRAKDHAIQLVDRQVLQQWMTQARSEIEQRGNAPRAPIRRPLCRPEGMRPTAAAILCLVLSGVIFAIFPPAFPKTQTASGKSTSRQVLSAPEKVVLELFADISRHNWPAVCGLSYHPSPCQGSDYHHISYGYKLTARDVVTSLMAHGDGVTARVLAYETTGKVQHITFWYEVRNGKITAGRSKLLHTTYPSRSRT